MFARVTINDVVYNDELISNIDFTSSAMSGKDFAIGSTHENAVTIVFSDVINTIAPLDRVTVEIGVLREPFGGPLRNISDVRVGQTRMGTRLNLWNSREDIEYTLMGEFYISDHVDVNYNDKITTIGCKDKMIFMEDDYVSELTYPADIREVIVEIANLSGVEIDTLNIEELEYIEVMKLEDYTYRQALGYLAQLLVGYVYFNRKGYLQIRQLEESDYEISTEEYYSKGLTKNGIRYRVQGIACTVPTDEEPQELFVGSKIGTQLQLENPLMTQHRLQIIYDKLQNIDYYPFDLEWRGNPAVEVGDLVTVYDVENNELKVPVLNYGLTYSGGLAAKSSADTESQTDIVASGRPSLKQQITATQRKITETATALTNAFKDAQEKITGNQGGFIIQRMNEDGKPYEFLVMDTEDINSATNVIRLNQQGIGFSQNGYNGPFGVAITIDGQIVADYITAGTLSAELIQSGFNDIAFGTSITQEGIKQVDASGEYAIIAGGGMRFYTNNDARVGSIETGYGLNDEYTSVSIFVNEGHGHDVVRRNEGAPNVNSYGLPADDDRLTLYENMNVNNVNIDNVNVLKFRDEAQIYEISNRLHIYGTESWSLNAGDRTQLTGYYDSSQNRSFVRLAADLNMNDFWISNVSSIDFDVSGNEIYSTASQNLILSSDSKIGLSGSEIITYATLNLNSYTIINQSDIRLKKHIEPAHIDALSQIDRLEFIEFKWDKDKRPNSPDGKQFGIKAQYAPFLQSKADGEDSYLSIDMNKQVNLNSKALQELHQKVKELEGELHAKQ